MIVRLWQSVCLVTSVALAPIANNRRDSILWFSDNLSMFKAVWLRKLSVFTSARCLGSRSVINRFSIYRCTRLKGENCIRTSGRNVDTYCIKPIWHECTLYDRSHVIDKWNVNQNKLTLTLEIKNKTKVCSFFWYRRLFENKTKRQTKPQTIRLIDNYTSLSQKETYTVADLLTTVLVSTELIQVLTKFLFVLFLFRNNNSTNYNDCHYSNVS